MNRLLPGVLAALLAGCNGAPPVQPSENQLSDAYSCYGVPDRSQCRFAYDKAGGPPIAFAGSSR